MAPCSLRGRNPLVFQKHKVQTALGCTLMAETHDTTAAKLAWLQELSEQAAHAGNEKAVARQRERGKLLARERVG